MVILEIEQKEDGVIEIVAKSRYDERFHKREIYEINDKRYQVLSSNRINCDRVEIPIYSVRLKKVVRETHHDFSDLDFNYIWRIERTSPTQIVMRTPTGDHSVHNYQDALKCYEDFVLVNEMRGVVNGKIRK